MKPEPLTLYTIRANMEVSRTTANTKSHNTNNQGHLWKKEWVQMNQEKSELFYLKEKRNRSYNPVIEDDEVKGSPR